MSINNQSLKKAVDIYADAANLVLRLLLKEPQKDWTSLQLAKSSGTSTAWANHVLNALEKRGILERQRAGGKSRSKLLKPKELIRDWTTHYDFSKNVTYPFYVKTVQERNSLFKYFKASGIEYAATGYYTVSLLTGFVSGVPEMFYVYHPQKDIMYSDLIMRLSNQFSLLPVQKGANLIIVKPYYRRGVFFDSKFFNNEKIVSPIQLYLDIYHLDQGREFIKELAGYFHKEGFYYV